MTTAFELVYVRREEEPVLAPPRSEVGAVGWLRGRLLSSPVNAVFTGVAIALVILIVPPLVRWALIDAVWSGKDREVCAAPGAGACWAFVTAKFQQFIYGRYPVDERWRVNLTGILLVIGLVPMAIPRVPFKRETGIYLLVIFPIAATILLTGGNFGIAADFLPGLLVFGGLVTGLVGFVAAGSSARLFAGLLAPLGVLVMLIVLVATVFAGYGAARIMFLGSFARLDHLVLIAATAVAFAGGLAGIVRTSGRPAVGLLAGIWLTLAALAVLAFLFNINFHLTPVETSLWGGLMVTLVVAIVGIVASLPIGVILALGRRSRLPVLRVCSVIFIEFVRGVPLITVLFMASVMLPLFLPPGVNFDKLLRALIGVALFSAAYMAEVVRGGLQAIGRGQYEAAQALGLGYGPMMRLIILPQALKIVIPGIVNSFISLFKDTSLVLIIGIFDLLGIVQLNFADSNWAAPQTPSTGYVFAGLVFWLFCFTMSRYSIYTERRLRTGHRR